MEPATMALTRRTPALRKTESTSSAVDSPGSRRVERGRMVRPTTSPT
jgi:hypothetical protein